MIYLQNEKIETRKCFRNMMEYNLHENTHDIGNRGVSFAVSKNLFIRNTNLIIKQFTKHLNGNTKNQIHHLLINKRHFNFMEMRSYRGANIGCPQNPVSL